MMILILQLSVAYFQWSTVAIVNIVVVGISTPQTLYSMLYYQLKTLSERRRFV